MSFLFNKKPAFFTAAITLCFVSTGLVFAGESSSEFFAGPLSAAAETVVGKKEEKSLFKAQRLGLKKKASDFEKDGESALTNEENPREFPGQTVILEEKVSKKIESAEIN